MKMMMEQFNFHDANLENVSLQDDKLILSIDLYTIFYPSLTSVDVCFERPVLTPKLVNFLKALEEEKLQCDEGEYIARVEQLNVEPNFTQDKNVTVALALNCFGKVTIIAHEVTMTRLHK